MVHAVGVATAAEWLSIVVLTGGLWVSKSSGQIIATSHDLTSKGSFLEGKSPAISGISRLVNYYI